MFRQGHLAIEDHNCVACHRPNERLPLSQQFAKRPAPRLTNAGARLKAGWIYHWLAKPEALRPEATMPELFTADQRGDVERFAVATYLAAQGGTIAIVPDPPAEVMRQTAAEGGQLFTRVRLCGLPSAAGGSPATRHLACVSAEDNTRGDRSFLAKARSRGAGRADAGVHARQIGQAATRALRDDSQQRRRRIAGIASRSVGGSGEAAYAANEADEANRANSPRFLRTSSLRRWPAP